MAYGILSRISIRLNVSYRFSLPDFYAILLQKAETVVNISIMEFHEKLQELRKKKGLTQEELAEQLYVSRTAVSKWESGRGFPNIESLKAISKYFSVSLDELLSSEALMVIAEDDQKQKAIRSRDFVFGLLDCSMALLFFLPFFGQRTDSLIAEVALPVLTALQPWLKTVYLIMTAAMVITGILLLALQNHRCHFWMQNKIRLSLCLQVASAFLFIMSRQPYAAAFTFLFLIIKAVLLYKQP